MIVTVETKERRSCPILSLDGGGGRGLFSAIVLAELERRLGKPLWQVFRLAAGTSTGGILGRS